MTDLTTSGDRGKAVKAVTGQLAPTPPAAQVEEDGKIAVTRDLPSEQKLDAQLDKEASKGIGAVAGEFDGKERKQRAVRTLANGKTEAVLVAAAPATVYPPDDGGYNPEKRWYAGPENTRVPHNVGHNATSDPSLAGWKDEHIKIKD